MILEKVKTKLLHPSEIMIIRRNFDYCNNNRIQILSNNQIAKQKVISFRDENNHILHFYAKRTHRLKAMKTIVYTGYMLNPEGALSEI